MYKVFFTAGLLTIAACASHNTVNTGNRGRGDTRTTEIEFLDDDTYILTEQSTDASYGYDKANPIKVGGSKEQTGPENQRNFLNALLGPHGETVRYYRAGSCCPFKTPNGLINNTGMLDIYTLTYTGSSDTLSLYLNLYDKGDLMIPVGFTAKKKN